MPIHSTWYLVGSRQWLLQEGCVVLFDFYRRFEINIKNVRLFRVFFRMRAKPPYKYCKKNIKYILMPWIMSLPSWNFYSCFNYLSSLLFQLFLFVFYHGNIRQKNNKHAKKQHRKTFTIFFTQIITHKIRTKICFCIFQSNLTPSLLIPQVGMLTLTRISYKS